MPELTGKVASITFRNQQNQFAIARLETDDEGLVAILGTLGSLSVGETIRVSGEWENHPRFGRQFKVQSFSEVLPASVSGIEEYLGSGLVPGIGPALAKRIVDRFGAETLSIMDNEPRRLLSVSGIGRSKLARLMESWAEKKAQRDTMVFLSGHGVGPGLAARILKAYGASASAVIRQNPYRLAADVTGIGFARADEIAKSLGFSPDSPFRLYAGVVHVLSRAADQGHFYLPEDLLRDQAAELLELSPDLASRAMEELGAEGGLVLEEIGEGGARAVFLPAFHAVEVGLARRLLALLSVPYKGPDWSRDEINARVLRRFAIALSETQISVLEKILHCRVGIITGGPGTGKTTLTRSLILLYEAMGKQVALAAPTGRAAKRMSEVTGREARTIHRLLAYDPVREEFSKNEDEPLEADVIIIDEASMVDTFLMHHLVRAVPMNAVLVLVGDVFQLPPVGPGNTLKDIIASGRAPVFVLTEIFRQAKESLIVRNAHRVNEGESILTQKELHNPRDSDFFFQETDDPEAMVALTLSLICERIPSAYPHIRRDDIQVLTPMHKGPAGTIALNKALQDALNPRPDVVESQGRSFRPGDRVMQLKNNYTKEVYNGDIGVVVHMDREAGVLTVEYDTGAVRYEFTELDELTLAYAISVHKSQGSEYPAVVLLLSTGHYVMLQRNLIYTAITRAKKLLVLVASRRAVEMAIRNNQQAGRMTRLRERLAWDDAAR
ncbi:MAG: ATP-dependent RecD-like DNA helicase [Thermodesulfobacteriota bacterium]